MTTEKNLLRKNSVEKNEVIESLKHEVEALARLRSQLSSRSEQLMNERLDLEQQVESLGMQVSFCGVFFPTAVLFSQGRHDIHR